MSTSLTPSNTLDYGWGDQASVTFSSWMSCLVLNVSLHCKTFLCTSYWTRYSCPGLSKAPPTMFHQILDASYSGFRYTCVFIHLPSIPGWGVFQSHCAQWLPTFLAIEAISLLTNNSRSDDDLEDIFHSFAPSNPRMSIIRLYKYCEDMRCQNWHLHPFASLCQCFYLYLPVVSVPVPPHVPYPLSMYQCLCLYLPAAGMLEYHVYAMQIRR